MCVIIAVPTPSLRFNRVSASIRSTMPAPERSTRQSSSMMMRNRRCGADADVRKRVRRLDRAEAVVPARKQHRCLELSVALADRRDVDTDGGRVEPDRIRGLAREHVTKRAVDQSEQRPL